MTSKTKSGNHQIPALSRELTRSPLSVQLFFDELFLPFAEPLPPLALAGEGPAPVIMLLASAAPSTAPAVAPATAPRTTSVTVSIACLIIPFFGALFLLVEALLRGAAFFVLLTAAVFFGAAFFGVAFFGVAFLVTAEDLPLVGVLAFVDAFLLAVAFFGVAFFTTAFFAGEAFVPIVFFLLAEADLPVAFDFTSFLLVVLAAPDLAVDFTPAFFVFVFVFDVAIFSP